MATLPFQIYRWADGTPQAEVGGIVRPISDPQALAQYGITDYSTLPYHPATGMAGPVRGGTTGGAMALQDLINQQNTYTQQNQPAQAPAPAPAQNPNAFRPRNADENMTAYLQAKQAHEMQQTGTSTVSFGTPQVAQPQVAQPAVQVPVAQQPAQPVAPTSTNPNDYDKVNTGNIGADGKPIYDIYDKATGLKVTGEQGLPLFQAGLNADHIPERVTPPPQMPAQQGAQQGAQQPQAPQPAQPITTAELATTKPYVQYEGSPDVFERATGKYMSGEEASKIPDFFSQVEQAKSVRPGVTTEKDFAKLAQTNLKLQQSGATTTPQDFQDNPLKAFQDTYSQIWSNLGLGSVKTQIETTLKAMKEVDNEMIDKISEVNDNPWLSEAERSRQVTKMQSKYEQKNAVNVKSLKLLQGVFEMGQQEAQFVTTNALNAFNQQQTFDQQVLLKQMDLAEKMATTMKKKSFRDLVGSDGKMHTYIVNDAGEKVADLGVSEVAKTTGDGLTNIQIDNARAVASSFENSPIVKNFLEIQDRYLNAKTYTGRGDGATDIATIYDLMKVLDPTSVVREAEYDTGASKSGNIFAGALARFNGLINPEGGFVSEQAKNNIFQVITDRYNTRKAVYDNFAKQKQMEAESAAPGYKLTDYASVNVTETTPSTDPEAELSDDIVANASNYKTREELISALTAIYPEFTKDQIAEKVYSAISDQQAQQITSGFK